MSLPTRTIGAIGSNDLPNSVEQVKALSPPFHRQRLPLAVPCSPALTLGSAPHRRRLSVPATSPISHQISQFSAHFPNGDCWGGGVGLCRKMH
jgi:hypothetical protein